MTEPTPPKLIDDAVRVAALDILTAARELDEWDLPPGIVMIIAGDKPTYVPVPIPDNLWLDTHPVAVLHALNVGIAAGAISLRVGEDAATSLQATGEIVGVILFTEGHAVIGDNLTDAEKATLDDFKDRHRLEEHPKSRELRMATMVDRSLTTALANHVRGEEISEKIVYGFTGRIPDALRQLTTTLLASWMSEAQKAT